MFVRLVRALGPLNPLMPESAIDTVVRVTQHRAHGVERYSAKSDVGVTWQLPKCQIGLYNNGSC